MNKEEKQNMVNQLADQFSSANVIYLSDYKGLNVEAINTLRRELKKESFDFKVIKNTLIKLAAEKAGCTDLARDLVGPTAVTLGTDPVTPAKIIGRFSRDTDGLPEMKIGIVDGNIVSAGEIIRIGKLPSREELLAKMLGALNSPVTGLVGVMGGLLSAFVRTLAAVRDAKPAEAPAEEAKAEEAKAEEIPAEEAPAEAAPATEEAADTSEDKKE